VNRLFKTGRGQIFAAADGGLFTLDDAQTDKKFSRVPLYVPLSETESFPVFRSPRTRKEASGSGTSAA
jgi:hypothetical protein